MGVSEFGGVDTERLQLSDPTFHTRQQHPRGYRQGNFTDAADLFVAFGHTNATDYARALDLETAIATVTFRGRYYQTVGCAFDQEMIQENNAAFVRFAKLLGREDDVVVQRCQAQLGQYDPVLVGADGQIKEFREETHYNDFCNQPHHRHISHLVGLYPGSLINRTTPAWCAAARKTLDLRGDHTEAWALVHRMCCRARLGDGDRATILFANLMREKTADTLWSVAHGVHIIDANYAGTAAFTEMLVQSHERDAQGTFIVDLLPALPTAWKNEGSFKGLCVRGGWRIDCTWKGGRPVKVTLRAGAHAGARPFIRFAGQPLRDGRGN